MKKKKFCIFNLLILLIAFIVLTSNLLSADKKSTNETNTVFDPWLNGFPYRKPITISNSGSALANYQVLITNPIYNETGLVGSWHFDEGSGTVAADSSGNGNTGTLTNGPSWVTGKFGNALSFDGVDDYVSMSGFSIDKTKITVEVWVYPKSYGHGYDYTNADPIWYIGNGYSLGIFYRSDGKIHINGWNQTSGNSNGVVPLNQWTHIVFVQDISNSVMKLYINGLLDVSLSSSYGGTVTGLLIAKTKSMSPYFFNGTVDELRIYNRVLSADEIQALYQAKAKLNYDDIRFTDSDGTTLLNYWKEADGKFWVKVPSIPGSGTKTIYVYYGNSNASSASNGDTTFEFFDDFEDGIWTDKWIKGANNFTITESGGVLDISGTGNDFEYLESTFTFSPGIALYTQMRDDTSYDYPAEFGFGYRNYDSVPGAPSNNSVLRIIWTSDIWGLLVTNCEGSSCQSNYGSFNTDNSYHLYRLTWLLNEAKIWQDGVLKATLTSNVPSTSEKLRIGHPETVAPSTWRGIFNWIFVSKYSSSEPTTNIGSEDVLVTQAGSPTNWSWKVPSNGEKVRSGSSTNWQWITFQNDGTGITVPRGSATNWQWGP